MPFGVELPENLGSTPAVTESSGAAPEGAQVSTEEQSTDTSRGTPDSATPQRGTQRPTPTLTELDKLEKFRWQGREWTPKDLQKSTLMQADYTRRMQEFSETRKFSDNFAADLKTVIKDRGRLEEFSKIYPKEFVERAREILSELPGAPTRQAEPKAEVPDAFRTQFQAMEGKIAHWEKAQEQAEVQQIQGWLDHQFARLEQKYPDAHSEIVNARAEVLAARGEKITAETLERLFKQNDGELKARTAERQKTKVTQQIKVGKEGKDVGTGGDIAGGQPKKFKTIKEATSAFLSDIAASR
jgi:hypothetical protein